MPDRFPVFVGSTELIRGYTAGSIRNHEVQRQRAVEFRKPDAPPSTSWSGSKIASATWSCGSR